MKAQQARKMTDDATAITIDKVMEVIRMSTQEGNLFVFVPMYDKGIASELIGLGYKIDHDNENMLISWM